ncbi:DUF1554 domain-containing protein [Leptospira perolatii]|nr:DUF1554 domain-containing protein [Leptospira perolatii]
MKFTNIAIFSSLIIFTIHCLKFEPNDLDPSTPEGLLKAQVLSNSGIISIPPLVNPGFVGYVYVTSSLFNGSGLSGIDGADITCNSSIPPSLAGTGQYRALLNNTSGIGTARHACTTANCSGGIAENLNWVLKPNATYYQQNKTTVVGTTNASALFNFPLSAGFSPTPGSPTNFFWSGLTTSWLSGGECVGWTAVGGTAGAGDMISTTNTSVSASTGLFGCASPAYPILCVSQ